MPDESIIGLISDANKNRSKLVSSVDQIDVKLLQSGLAYKMQLLPEMVGVHPANRDGYGVHDGTVHALGADIVRTGWSWAACAHACGMEDCSSAAIENFSVSLSGASELLGKYKANDIKIGSLACSHTNAFLLAAKQGVPSNIEGIAEDGRISIGKITRADAGMQEALAKGLHWLIYKKEVGQMYPLLAKLVQEARNQHLVREENEIQLCLRIHDMAKHSNPFCVDWGNIAHRISSPRDVPALVNFVAKWPGGTNGQLLKDLLEFHRNHVLSGRVIPSQTFEGLASLKLAPEEHCPLFVMSVLKCQATCPEAKVQQKFCRFISQGDITTIQGKRLKQRAQAESILKQSRDIVNSIHPSLPSKIATKLLGKLDCHVVRFVFEKSKDFKSLEEIACSFVKA